MNRQELLLKVNWTYHDIMSYLGVGKTKAFEIKNIAIKQYGGYIKYLPNCVNRNAVLKMLGTSFDEEIKVIRKENNEETL